MSTSALKRVEAMKERHSEMLARARKRAAEAAQSQQHTLIAAGAAYAIGYAEKNGMNLPTVQGIDPKLLYGAGALVAAHMIKDSKTRQIAQSAGDGLIAICAYEQGKGTPLVRG